MCVWVCVCRILRTDYICVFAANCIKEKNSDIEPMTSFKHSAFTEESRVVLSASSIIMGSSLILF